MHTFTVSPKLSLTTIVQKDNKVLDQAQDKTQPKHSGTNANSVINHPSRLPLVILRTDYLALAQGNHCAAKLLAILENWTNWFVRQGKFERWVKLTSDSIIKHLLGEHNAKQIRTSLKLLVSLKFIRQEKRRSHKHDQAYFYWLDIELTQEAINALEPPQEKECLCCKIPPQNLRPETDEDNLKMEANLEAETPAHVDVAKSTTSPIKRLKPLRRLMRQNRPHRSGQIDSIDSAKSTDCLNRDSNKDLNSRNINIAVEETSMDEEEKTNQQGSSLRIPASLIEEPEPRAQPAAPQEGKCSAAPVVPKAESTPANLPTQVVEQPVLQTTLLATPAPVDLLDEREALNEMRRLGIKHNEAVRTRMKKYPGNVAWSLGDLKRRIAKGEDIKNVTGAFMVNLKKAKVDREPVDTEPSFGRHLELNPPTEQQLQALAEARSTGAVRDYFFSSIDNTHKVILVDGITQVPWWEYLGAVKP